MDSRDVGLLNSPLQRAENSGAEAFLSLRDEHVEAADGFNQLSVSLFQVLQLGRTFRSTRTQTWWGNQEKQVRTCPPPLSPHLRSTDCFYRLRQAEKPEADGQDAHFQAQGSHCDRQAHQAGAATDQHLCSHHGRYEAPSPDPHLRKFQPGCLLKFSSLFLQQVVRNPGKTRSSSNRSLPPTSTLWERSDTWVGGG